MGRKKRKQYPKAIIPKIQAAFGMQPEVTAHKQDKKLFKLYIITYCLCILMIGAFMGFSRIYISDYVPINGDWQNYNPVRRILAGYIPYVDFTPYLGLGVVALILPFVAISNTFTMSLFATNFMCIVCFILMTLTVLYLTTKRLRISMLGSLIILITLHVAKGQPITGFLYRELIQIGNSFRMGRAFIPVLLVIMLLIWLKYSGKDIFSIIENKKGICIIGSLCGFCVPWSNDYGFCSVAAFGLILALMLAYRRVHIKRSVLLCLFFAFASLLGLFMSVIIVTLGHPIEFVKISAGIADYQFWYYGAVKITNFSGLLKAQCPLIIPVPLCYAVLAFKMWKRQISSSDVLLFFLLTTALGASILYTFGAGGVMNTVLLYVSLTAVIGWTIGLFVGIIERFSKINTTLKTTSILRDSFTALLLIFLACSYFLFVKPNAFRSPKNIPYVHELGGYTSFGNSLTAAKEFLGNERFFSTYAGALEVMTDSFQPSGTDYIIHVLGDQQREKYIHNFEHGNYKYVQTIHHKYINWEKWVQSANWFFYRKLLTDYTPVRLFGYSVIWERMSVPIAIYSGTSNVYIAKKDDSSSQIVVKLDDNVNCIADIIIEYDTNLIMNSKSYKMYVLAKDDAINHPFGRSSSLRNFWGIPIGKNITYNIPVIVNNGIGVVGLFAVPATNARINVTNAVIDRLLAIPDIEFLSTSND